MERIANPPKIRCLWTNLRFLYHFCLFLKMPLSPLFCLLGIGLLLLRQLLVEGLIWRKKMKMFWPQIRDKLCYLLACNQTTPNSCVSGHSKSKGSFTLAMFVCDKARDIATWHRLPYLPWQIQMFPSVPKVAKASTVAVAGIIALTFANGNTA